MNIKVTSFTTPIDPNLVITPVPKSFSSGGGSGGSVAVTVSPHQPTVFRYNGGVHGSVGNGSYILLGSVTMPLLGNRLLWGYANCLVNQFAGDVDSIDFGIWATLDANPPPYGLGGNGMHLTHREVEVSYQNPNPPPNQLTTNGPVLMKASCSMPLVFNFYGSTVGLTGNHTVNLWIRNTSNNNSTPVAMNQVYWGLFAMEQDVV